MSLLENEISKYMYASVEALYEFEQIDEETVHVSMPQTFGSGAMLSLQVTFDGDRALVTDRGLSADQLFEQGLSVDSPAIHRSFKSVAESTGFTPNFGAEFWEISATVARGDVALGLQAVADAAMRADGLSALSKKKRGRSFAEQVVQRIGGVNLPIVPRAPILGRHGSRRQVTARVDGDQQVFVQALPGRTAQQRMESFDHASGLFRNAIPDVRHRIAVIDDGQWERWQVVSLREICRVSEQDGLTDLIHEAAAA